jgi:hypothetical protein
MPGFFDASLLRIGEANPGYAKLASALFHKKPAHRAAMPGFFDASPA